jgi:hypothetical protein
MAKQNDYNSFGKLVKKEGEKTTTLPAIPKKPEVQSNSLVISNITRYPLQLGNDAAALKRSFHDDHALVRDIIVFIARKMKIDLFNSLIFTLAEFAKEMKYSIHYLTRTREDVSKMKKTYQPKLNGHLFDGNFEYVLYKMVSTNLMFSGGDKNNFSMAGIKLVSDIQITIDPKVRNKRIYTIKLANEFIQSVLKQYQRISYNDYVYSSLGSTRQIGGLRSLYVKLCHMQYVSYSVYKREVSMNKTTKFANPYYETTVDELCEIGDISIALEPKEKKKALTRLLENIKKNLKELQFSYEYFSNTDQRVKFLLRISFPISSNNLKEFRNESVFWTNLLALLKERFESLYPEKVLNIGEDLTTYNKFSEWLIDQQKDINLKVCSVQESYLSATGVSISSGEALRFISGDLAKELH